MAEQNGSLHANGRKVASATSSFQKSETAMDNETRNGGRIQTFYHLTPIHGFRFILESKNRLETAFWYLIIVISIGFLVDQIFQLGKDFQSKETLTKVTLMLNDTLYFPQTVMCIFASSHDLHMNTSKKIDNSSIGYPSHEEIAGFLTQSNFSTAQWSKSMIDFSWDFLVNVSEFETFRRPLERSRHEKDMSQFDWTIQRLYKNNLTLSDFTEKFAEQILEIVNFQLFYQDQFQDSSNFSSEHTLTNISEDSRIIRIFPKQICYRLPLNRLHVSKTDIEMKRLLIRLNLPKGQTGLAPAVLLRFHSSGSQQEPMKFHETFRQLRFFPGYKYTLTMEIQGHYNSLPWTWPNKLQHCFPPEQEGSHCLENNCLRKLFNRVCPCQNFYKVQATQSRKLCTSSDYEQCLKNLQNEETLECLNNSVLCCEQWLYRISRTETPAVKAEQLEITMEYDCFDYPVFQEIDTANWRVFLGTVGGSVALLMGASIISLIHCCLHFLRCPKSCFKRRYWQRPRIEEQTD